MPLYLQDGAAGGHAAWCEEALTAGVADGAIISPFFTPLNARPHHPSGADLANRVRAAGGTVIFDATTHGALLPGVNYWANYRQWSLWGGARGDLSQPPLITEHVERVFAHQTTLGSVHLTPTVPLDSPVGPSADAALDMAEEGRKQDPAAWQSLAGRRGFWLSADLDAYVGSLASLRAPVWFVTLIRDRLDYPPDTTDWAQTAAVCRTIQSLARRSRVVVCHSDLYGLPGIAAGADSVGTAWHSKQRICCPATFQSNDPDQIRRQAQWLTYEGLTARLHSQFSDILHRADRPRAEALYTGAISMAGRDRRVHHLGAVRNLVSSVDSAGSVTRDRVQILRDLYQFSTTEIADLASRYGRPFEQARAQQIDGPWGGLEAYATVEGF